MIIDFLIKLFKSAPFSYISLIVCIATIITYTCTLLIFLSPVEKMILNNDDHFAIALYVICIFIKTSFFFAFGSLIGTSLALIGFIRNENKRSITYIALFFNILILFIAINLLYRNIEF